MWLLFVLPLPHVTTAPLNTYSVIIDLFTFIHVKYAYINLSLTVMGLNYVCVLLAVLMRTVLPMCVFIILSFEQ